MEERLEDGGFTCADCGKASPTVPEGETQSKKLAWRFTPKVTAGVASVEARCPECFARYRASLTPETPVWWNYRK